MGTDEDMKKNMRNLLKRTGLLIAWEAVKDDVIKRRELEHLAFEIDSERTKSDVIIAEQDGCLWCKKKDIKLKERHSLKSGAIICRRCWNRGTAIKKAHPDFKCKCGAYLPLPENINIWTKERDGSWVCISCSHRKKTARIKDIDMEGQIFIPVIRYKLNGHLLFVVRTRAKLAIKKLAEYCGWSKDYQYALQKANQGGEKQILTIPMEAKNKIENAFVEFTGKRPEEWLADGKN